MFNPKLSDIFSCLVLETVKAKDLKRGDVAFIHSRWNLVLDAKKRRDLPTGYKQDEIIDIFGMDGNGLLPLDYDVKIAKRGIFDSNKLDEFITEYKGWRHEMEESFKKEQEEEREREKAELRRRLKDLED